MKFLKVERLKTELYLELNQISTTGYTITQTGYGWDELKITLSKKELSDNLITEMIELAALFLICTEEFRHLKTKTEYFKLETVFTINLK